MSMSSLYKEFKADDRATSDGVWIEYDVGAKSPVRFRVRQAGGTNPAYLKALEKHTKPLRRRYRNGDIPLDKVNGALVHVFAEAVITGWENVEDEAGRPLAFNRENVVKVLTDLPFLFEDIKDQAGNFDLFRAELREADAGN